MFTLHTILGEPKMISVSRPMGARLASITIFASNLEAGIECFCSVVIKTVLPA